MPQQTINIGAAPNDGTGDPLRDAFDKTNDNFDELYGMGDGAAAILQGIHTIPILAAAMIARTTNGAASGTTESATNKVMLKTLDFDKDADEFAQIPIPMPPSWDEGTVRARFYWTTTGTGDCIWSAQAMALTDSDVIDTAFGSAQSVTDSVTSANDLMISGWTAPITIGDSPAMGDLVVFQFSRDANNGSDTLNADAKLIGVQLEITINAGDDS